MDTPSDKTGEHIARMIINSMITPPFLSMKRNTAVNAIKCNLNITQYTKGGHNPNEPQK